MRSKVSLPRPAPEQDRHDRDDQRDVGERGRAELLPGALPGHGRGDGSGKCEIEDRTEALGPGWNSPRLSRDEGHGRQARGPDRHRGRVETDRFRVVAPSFHGHGRKRRARRGEDDREHGDNLAESCGPELTAKDEDDPAEAHADAEHFLDREAFRLQECVGHEGGLERKGREEDRGEATEHAVVLAPVDGPVVRGEEDDPDESNERPFGPVLWPLRPEYDPWGYRSVGRNAEPQRAGPNRPAA